MNTWRRGIGAGTRELGRSRDSLSGLEADFSEIAPVDADHARPCECGATTLAVIDLDSADTFTAVEEWRR